MFSIDDVLSRLNIPYLVYGDRVMRPFDKIMPVGQEDGSTLVFINKPDSSTIQVLLSCKAAIALVREDWAKTNTGELNGLPLTVVAVTNPRLVAARIAQIIHADEDLEWVGVHATAVIHPDAQIHPTVCIGPYANIGKCTVGMNSAIGAYTTIKSGTIIGQRVTIREHCLVGGPGFGFERADNGELIRIPHSGRVVIEDDVELFPFVNVDRATYTETRIKRGAKIDHFCHISHNSTVGEHSLLTAGTILCGGSSVGARVWTGVGSIIKEKVKVGDGCTLGLGAVVLKDTDPGSVLIGIPARPLIK